MLKNFLNMIGIGTAAASPLESASAGPKVSGPYQEDASNLIYQLLFCDRPELFKPSDGRVDTPPWSVLFAEKPDFDGLANLAGDAAQESRIRMVAYHLLRASGKTVPKRVLLGTIIEVRMPGGLDTLAVFTDGGARYINQSGKMAIVEGSGNLFDDEIEAVLKASEPIVAAIGPWDKDRLPPPQNGSIRLTFLVSDGLYFGEGPMNLMQSDQMAAPLINAATALLTKLVSQT